MKTRTIDGVTVLSTIELTAVLGVQISFALMTKLGLKPFAQVRNGIFWREDDIPVIAKTLAVHFERIAAKPYQNKGDGHAEIN